ncbi:MAG: response regulator transcription factor [Anaerolineaceae bacterium]
MTNQEQPTIRILIADDHAIVRKGLRTLITHEPGLELVAEASNGLEAIALTRQFLPDVILMDLVMAKMDGITAIKVIKNEFPDAHILVLTSFAEDDKVFPAIKSGALGYLLKDSTPEQLIEAIHDVYRGEPSLPPRIAIKMMEELNRPPDLPPTESPLTTREMEVLRLVAQGLDDEEIAAKLVISKWTVRTHIRNILNKLHLANRLQAALYALREKLADL